jgi:hypothetical protein
MSSWEHDGLRILAQYVRKNSPTTADPGPAGDYDETLRVDGQGLIPRAEPKYCVQISLQNDPQNYRIPVPPEFNRQGYFIVKAVNLPVTIPYDADVKISIIETDRKGEKIIAQSPLRYRTV